MKSALALIAIVLSFMAGAIPVSALNPSLEISQYAHTAWTVRDGFSLGNIYAIAQTPDGYLWLGSEFGLFRFDGVRSIAWQPPAGQQLPEKDINSLLVTRDGTLWIGTFAGLATWHDGKLTWREELGRQFVASLFEDRDGTVWAATLETAKGRLCAIRVGTSRCYGQDGTFGRAIWSLYEDNSGHLWAAAQSGLWRIKPGPPRQFRTPTELIGLSRADDGRLLIAVHNGGLLKFVNDRLEKYAIRDASHSNRLMRDKDIDSNRLLRDRDGGLWIGTVERGLIHVYQGRTDVFTKADGLSGDVILAVFEDREGNVWVSSTGGLDRFRELTVSTISVKQGLSSDATQSVLAADDGSIWVGAHLGLTRWKDGQATVFRKGSGLPDEPESLYQDRHGRILVSTRRGLASLQHGTFTTLQGIPGGEVHSISDDAAGNLWLSGSESLFHLRNDRLLNQIPWAELGHYQNAGVLLSASEPGGVWMGFWAERGLAYFRDGRIHASYTEADGLGGGEVGGLRLDNEGAIWAATHEGGLSRIKDGRITTLTSKNGLPCDAVHWSIEDNDRSTWLYTSCGLVRIKRSELEAWVADPQRRIKTTVWDAADGVRLRSGPPSAYGPRVTKSSDGKLWFATGEGIQVVDPHHLADNKLLPPVHIEQIIINGKPYDVSKGLRLPAGVRDMIVQFTALSLAVPEKVRFRVTLEGQDSGWRELVNQRQVHYTNLAPRAYRFRVVACNNSGVWNEQGDSIEFSVAPAYYQTNWFRVLCAAGFLLLFWAAHRLRVGRLQRQFEMTLEARVEERTRIARDLHDTLLQSAHGVLLRFQAVAYLLPEGSMARQKLENAIERTAEFISEARDQVQGLRMSTVESNNLAQAIRVLGDELATQSPDPCPSFHMAVEGESRDLHPILRDEIYKMAAEALRNAFQHAHAQRVEVELHYDNAQFRLRVRDDGKGMDEAVLAQGIEGHYGLPGMRERASLLGGKLTVWSALGAGTEVELRVSADKAYASGRVSWFSRKFARKAKA